MATAIELNTSNLDLGFVEECESYLLTNRHFPSKVGGKPAWLELDEIPSVNDLKCLKCQEQLTFLLQVYASLDSSEQCFHRTIFLFICRNQDCWQSNCSKNILALRSQLPRNNKFYDFDPSRDDIEEASIPSKHTICIVCGGRGPLTCSKCKASFYCGAAHQKIDWRNGHKQKCNGESISNILPKSTSFLFPEYELLLETEINSDDSSPSDLVAKVDEELEKLQLPENIGTMQDVPESELSQFTNVQEDTTFGRFKKRVEQHQDQVLRYDRGGDPLWISSKNCLDLSNVEKCQLCNGPRVFEFQIMPQLLNHLKDDGIDWGIINVYTCENSCDTDSKYVREFVYKQDVVNES